MEYNLGHIPRIINGKLDVKPPEGWSVLESTDSKLVLIGPNDSTCHIDLGGEEATVVMLQNGIPISSKLVSVSGVGGLLDGLQKTSAISDYKYLGRFPIHKNLIDQLTKIVGLGFDVSDLVKALDITDYLRNKSVRDVIRDLGSDKYNRLYKYVAAKVEQLNKGEDVGEEKSEEYRLPAPAPQINKPPAAPIEPKVEPVVERPVVVAPTDQDLDNIEKEFGYVDTSELEHELGEEFSEGPEQRSEQLVPGAPSGLSGDVSEEQKRDFLRGTDPEMGLDPSTHIYTRESKLAAIDTNAKELIELLYQAGFDLSSQHSVNYLISKLIATRPEYKSLLSLSKDEYSSLLSSMPEQQVAQDELGSKQDVNKEIGALQHQMKLNDDAIDHIQTQIEEIMVNRTYRNDINDTFLKHVRSLPESERQERINKSKSKDLKEAYAEYVKSSQEIANIYSNLIEKYGQKPEEVLKILRSQNNQLNFKLLGLQDYIKATSGAEARRDIVVDPIENVAVKEYEPPEGQSPVPALMSEEDAAIRIKQLSEKSIESKDPKIKAKIRSEILMIARSPKLPRTEIMWGQKKNYAKQGPMDVGPKNSIWRMNTDTGIKIHEGAVAGPLRSVKTGDFIENKDKRLLGMVVKRYDQEVENKMVSGFIVELTSATFDRNTGEFIRRMDWWIPSQETIIMSSLIPRPSVKTSSASLGVIAQMATDNQGNTLNVGDQITVTPESGLAQQPGLNGNMQVKKIDTDGTPIVENTEQKFFSVDDNTNVVKVTPLNGQQPSLTSTV